MTQMENRRRPRLETRQTASVLVMGTTVACEVRNFCRTGLYLVFADRVGANRVANEWRAGAPAEVLFTAVVGEQLRLFRFAGAVAHASSTGLGLIVPAMPEEAFEALRAAARSKPATPGSKPAAVDAADPRQRCSALFKDCLRRVLDEFHQGLDAALNEGADKAGVVPDKLLLREATVALKVGRAPVEGRFLARAMQGLAPQAQVSARAASSDKEQVLALLEESEFEDWLRLADVIKRLESDLKGMEPLLRMERRYAKLTGRPIDRQSNPFGPSKVCQAFQAAIRELPLSNSARAVAYQGFGRALGVHLPGLFEQLDDALSGLGEREPDRWAASPSDTSPAPAPSQDRPEAQTDDRHGAGVPMLPELTNRAPDPPRQGEPQSGRDYSLDNVLASLKRANHVSPGLAERPGSAAAQGPRIELLSVAQDLMRARASALGQLAQPGPASPTQAGYAVATTADLARLIEAAPAAGWMEAPGAGRQPLSERMAMAAGGLNIGAPMRQALDSTGALLGKALTVSGGGKGIDGLLKRLEQPLLKLSLREGGFPDAAEHPARQVVDLLEQYAIAVDDDGRFFDPKLQRYLQIVVDRICRHADQFPEVYGKARDGLLRLLPPLQQTRQSRVEQLQETCEGRQRVRLARRRVQEELHRRLTGRAVPTAVLGLLEAGWRQALVMLESRVGREDARWTDAMALLDQVLSLLSPDSTDTPAARRQAALTASDQLDVLLASVNPLADTREAALAEFQRSLDMVAQGRAAPATKADEALFGSAGDGGDATDAALAALARRLRLGDWWQVLKSGTWVPMQLVWCSEQAAECAFTNRSATRKLDISLANLARQISEGTMREATDQAQPLLERSVQALVDEATGQMLQRAHHDPLTGLLSRKGFLQRLAQTAPNSTGDLTHLVGVIEFDQLRALYQACGVTQGEALARTLAEMVKGRLGHDVVLASFRDDTIWLMLPACRRDEGLNRLDQLLVHLNEFRYQTEGQSYSVGANMGVAELRPGVDSPDVAVQQADMACVAAKSLGRNRMQCYASEDRQLRSQQDMVSWMGRIDSLLAGNGLYLRCQLIMPIAADTGLKPYHEVLLGLEQTPGQSSSPQPFILAAEGLRRAHEVDLWVLRQTFNWIRQHRSEFSRDGGVSINLSATSLAHPSVIEALRQELLPGDIPTELIAFEITETAAIESYAAAEDFIRQMRRYGFRFALDDFGSGHTSYRHLKNLRVEALKIDGSFVKDILDSPDDFAIVKSMNDIAHSLGMRTVAEYVESPAILAKLREIGVDYAQGYAIQKPCRIDQLLTREAA
jgi:diguanylate cyclase (GGDEF)-like protein